MKLTIDSWWLVFYCDWRCIINFIASWGWCYSNRLHDRLCCKYFIHFLKKLEIYCSRPTSFIAHVVFFLKVFIFQIFKFILTLFSSMWVMQVSGNSLPYFDIFYSCAGKSAFMQFVLRNQLQYIISGPGNPASLIIWKNVFSYYV